jgi:hypothetical protein
MKNKMKNIVCGLLLTASLSALGQDIEGTPTDKFRVTVNSGSMEIWDTSNNGSYLLDTIHRSEIKLEQSMMKLYESKDKTGELFLLPSRVVISVDNRGDIRGDNAQVRYAEAALLSYLYTNEGLDNMQTVWSLFNYKNVAINDVPSQGQNRLNMLNILNVSVKSRDFSDGKVHFVYDFNYSLIPMGLNDTNKFFKKIDQSGAEANDFIAFAQNNIGYNITADSQQVIGIDIKQIARLKLGHSLYVAKGIADYQNMEHPRDFMNATAGYSVKSANLDFRVDKILNQPKLGNLTLGFYYKQMTAGVTAYTNWPDLHQHPNYTPVDQVQRHMGVSVKWVPLWMNNK